jgi:hypothetical protein
LLLIKLLTFPIFIVAKTPAKGKGKSASNPHNYAGCSGLATVIKHPEIHKITALKKDLFYPSYSPSFNQGIRSPIQIAFNDTE